MPLALHTKYIYDESGKIVEDILPLDEYEELRQRAGRTLSPASDDTTPPRKESEGLSAAVMTEIARHGGALEWLKDEPDIYSDRDGEPV